MPTPTKGARLGGSPSHERIILGNLAGQLFEHGRITTTEAKARRLRPLAEKLITKAKRGDLHARRQVMRVINENADGDIVHTLFTQIAPSFADREGGYVRITKVGPRKGDNAPMAVIELVTESVEEGRKNKDAVRKAAGKKSAAKRPPTPAPEDAPAPEEAVAPEESAAAPDGAYRGENPPEGFDIKGNEDSMKYHTPDSPWYDRTVAEVWFNSAEAAEQAGFVNAVAEQANDETAADERPTEGEAD